MQLNVIASMDDVRGQLILLASAGLLYVGGRGAVDTLSPLHDKPLGRAVGHWMPIALVALMATWLGAPGAALGVIIGTSVGALSLVNGSIHGIAEGESVPPGARPREVRIALWPFVFPVALIVFLAGFEGHLRMAHGVWLALVGLACVVMIWPARVTQLRLDRRSAVNLALAVSLSMIGAFLAVRAITSIAGRLNLSSPQLVATTALGPLLVLPMILTGAQVVKQHPHRLAIDSQVTLVLLNLCLLLPCCIFLWKLKWAMGWVNAEGAGNAIDFPFPLNLWRLDSAAVVMLSLFLLPAGRLKMGTMEGSMLVLFYFAYIALISLAQSPAMQFLPGWLRAI